MGMNTGNRALAGVIALLGLVSLLIGLVVMLLLPDIRFAAWLILFLGVLLLVIAFIIDYRRVGRALTGRRGLFGVGTTVMASIFIGIVVFVNAISIGNYQRFDLTALSQFTITPQTKEVLKELKSPVTITGFFAPGNVLKDYVTGLLTEYSYHSDKLSIDYVDPDAHPDVARKYGVVSEWVVFEGQVEGRKNVKLVPPQDIAGGAEHVFTSAILQVTGVAQKKVYFLSGHGEADIQSQAADGYLIAKVSIQNELYLLGTVNLAAMTEPVMPADTAVLVIAAPQLPISDREIEAIGRYLKAGGQALVLANAGFPEGLNQLMSTWGVRLERGTIIDPSSPTPLGGVSKRDIPLVPAQRDAFGLPFVYFPGAVAVVPVKGSPVEKGVLAATSNDAWLAREFDPQKEPVFDEAGGDLKGPLAIGQMIAAPPIETGGTKLTRLIILGDSDFASNQHVLNANNLDLFIGTIDWLAEETELVSVRQKVLPFRALIVSPVTTRFITYSSVALLPLLVLVAGAVVWWRRR